MIDDNKSLSRQTFTQVSIKKVVNKVVNLIKNYFREDVPDQYRTCAKFLNFLTMKSNLSICQFTVFLRADSSIVSNIL